MSRSKRRVALVIVLFAAFVAACLGIDPHLSSTAQLSVVINPGSADFGDVTVFTTSSPPIDIVISPAGTADQLDTVMGGSDSCGASSPFKVTGPFPTTVSRMCMGSGTATTFNEPSGTGGTGTCTTVTATYQATFTPQAPGVQSCTFTFFGTFGNIPVTLTGNGVAPVQPQIAVTPGAINFGDIRVSTTSGPTNITISNVGGQTLQINSISHTDLATFSVAGNTGSHGIVPGGFEQHAVTCTPGAPQPFSDTVVISSNAANAPTVSIGLTCNGTDSAISMTGNPPDLLTRVGEAKDQTITLRNEGGATSNITALNLASGVGAHLTKTSGPPIPVGLGSGSTVDVVVHYDAAVPQDFGELGRLQITTADGKNQEFVINGGALITSLGLNPDTVDFGPICAGKNASMPVAVFASAQGDVLIDAVSTPATPFEFMPGQSLPATAKGNHGNDVLFTAKVAPVAAGTFDKTVTLDTDLPGAPTRMIALHADALPAGVTATPGMLDFGTIAANLVAPAQSVQLTNCNAADLTITGAHIEGAAPGEFAIVSQDVAGTVAPAASKEVLVVMTPHSPGPKLAVLAIEHGETTFVDLVGNGEGGVGGDDDDRVTYYRCNAGGPVGLAPLALVLLALRRRRRR